MKSCKLSVPHLLHCFLFLSAISLWSCDQTRNNPQNTYTSQSPTVQSAPPSQQSLLSADLATQLINRCLGFPKPQYASIFSSSARGGTVLRDYAPLVEAGVLEIKSIGYGAKVPGSKYSSDSEVFTFTPTEKEKAFLVKEQYIHEGGYNYTPAQFKSADIVVDRIVGIRTEGNYAYVHYTTKIANHTPFSAVGRIKWQPGTHEARFSRYDNGTWQCN